MSRLIFGAMWLAHFLPLAALRALGGAVGWAAFRLIGERRRVTCVNLEKCFPALDGAARERLARAHFRAFCQAFLDRGVLWWSPRARVERIVRLEGLEHLHALGGAPAILLVPHFVGLDAGATRLSCEITAAGMYSRQKDSRFGELLARGRSRFGDIRLISRQEGVRAILAALREGRHFYYLPDQDYGPRGALFVPFFGVPAATMPGLARLAKLSGAPVLPCVTRMEPRGYVLRIEPPWENFPSGDPEADTRRVNAYIEQRVLEMPEQYHWMHKRFKTRPAGEAAFY
ncbi:MAG TPA: lipid A biosynthesis acyltransferase [Burkholderiales bacterium]|nr:lipid A biosynthesis acyltransferase [Burkholderiales bacterium]